MKIMCDSLMLSYLKFGINAWGWLNEGDVLKLQIWATLSQKVNKMFESQWDDIIIIIIVVVVVAIIIIVIIAIIFLCVVIYIFIIIIIIIVIIIIIIIIIISCKILEMFGINSWITNNLIFCQHVSHIYGIHDIDMRSCGRSHIIFDPSWTF